MHMTGAFSDRKVMAELTARMLLETEAVLLDAETPFIFTSGRASPVYIDCRKLISFPRVRQSLMSMGASVVLRDAGFECFDAVAGGETAGIPYAAWMADQLMLPMLYVRKKAKGFGRDAQIEGHLVGGQRVLLVEDLNTDGGSKVNFATALRGAGATVEHVFVVFNYGIFPETDGVMKEAGLTLHYLADWWDVLEAARAGGRFDARTLSEVEAFMKDPSGWSAAHGGTEAAAG
jgi:orotate phosphoribosyltransferase